MFLKGNMFLLEMCTRHMLARVGATVDDIDLAISNLPPEINGAFTVTPEGPVIAMSYQLLNTDPRGSTVIFTFAHELIHYQQWKQGRLQISDEAVVWNGVEYSIDDVRQLGPNAPWELEAEQLGLKMFHELMQHLDAGNELAS